MNTPNINVTPLIDVLLVLLIIFMIVSPLRPSQIETRTPRPEENEDKQDVLLAMPLLVNIETNGRILVGGLQEYEVIEDLSALTTDLRQELEKDTGKNLDSKRLVLIKAPKSISYGTAIRVIDAVKLAGADPLILQIDALNS